MSSLLPYLCQYGSMDSCFIQWVIIQYHHYLFWCSNLANGSPFKLTSMSSLTFSHPTLSSPLLPNTKRHSSLSCTFSAPAWNQPFPQGRLIPFRGERYFETKIWVLRVFIALGCWCFWTLSVTTCVYFCIYFFIYLYLWKTWVHTDTSNSNPIPQSLL